MRKSAKLGIIECVLNHKKILLLFAQAVKIHKIALNGA